METIAGRRLLSTSALSAVSAGKHRAATFRRAGPDADPAQDQLHDAVQDADADMIAVLKKAGTLAGTGSRGWRAAASCLFAPPRGPPTPLLRHIASERNHLRHRHPLLHGKHCLEVAFVSPATEDEDRVLAFLKRTFFRHEPSMVATGLSGRVPDSMLAMYRESLREGLSVMAVNADDSSDILGVAINGPARKGVDSKYLRNITAENEEVRKIYDLWAYTAERSEGWPDDLECVMEMKAVATDPKAGRSGLAARLTQLSRELAKERFDFPGFRADCTSLYSAKMAERLRIPKAFSFRYKDYLNKNGQPVFKIPAPHTEVCVFVDSFYSPQLPYDGCC